MNKKQTKAACAHFDESVNKLQLMDLLKLFNKTELQTEGINLYLIGGYFDERSTSIEVTNKIFECLSKFDKYNIAVRLLLTGKLNSTHKMIKDIKVAIPKYQNVAYDLRKGRFIVFDIKGTNIPYYTLRSAAIFDASSSSSSLRLIYDCCNQKHIKNGPAVQVFKWKCPNWVRQALKIQNLSEERILQC